MEKKKIEYSNFEKENCLPEMYIKIHKEFKKGFEIYFSIREDTTYSGGIVLKKGLEGKLVNAMYSNKTDFVNYVFKIEIEGKNYSFWGSELLSLVPEYKIALEEFKTGRLNLPRNYEVGEQMQLDF